MHTSIKRELLLNSRYLFVFLIFLCFQEVYGTISDKCSGPLQLPTTYSKLLKKSYMIAAKQEQKHTVSCNFQNARCINNDQRAIGNKQLPKRQVPDLQFKLHIRENISSSLKRHRELGTWIVSFMLQLECTATTCYEITHYKLYLYFQKIHLFQCAFKSLHESCSKLQFWCSKTKTLKSTGLSLPNHRITV